MNKIKKVYKKHNEIINYVVVGVLTTVVSLVSKWLLLFTILDPKNKVELQTAIVISWILSVSFAYFMNRIYVFKSKNKKVVKELMSFYVARILTLVIEMFIMWFLVTLLKLDSDLYVFILTIICQLIILILNYVFSKFIVFKKNE